MSEKHSILGGKVYVYQRAGSPVWQCSAYLAGKNRRLSTKEKSLSKAKQFAEDWYFGLRDKDRKGDLEHQQTFKDAATPAINFQIPPLPITYFTHSHFRLNKQRYRD